MKKKLRKKRINLNKSLLFILFVWENFVLHAHDGHRMIWKKLIHLLLLTFYFCLFCIQNAKDLCENKTIALEVKKQDMLIWNNVVNFFFTGIASSSSGSHDLKNRTRSDLVGKIRMIFLAIIESLWFFYSFTTSNIKYFDFLRNCS